MKIREIARRGLLFTFADEISVYLIRGRQRSFLCDTHLGPVSMAGVRQYLTDVHEGNLLVFNSHSDWDHVWGNCAFPESLIIAHAACRRRLTERGEYELATLADYRQGSVALRLPDLTFDSRLTFAAEGVEFIHAPGHTNDSAVCYDQEDDVLFMGDLVEDPIPYLDDADLVRYLQTLEWLRQFPAKVKITAHSGLVGAELIEANIRYVERMLAGITVAPEIYREAVAVHRFNINNRLFLAYENRIREKMGETFAYEPFRRSFGDLQEVGYEALREDLDQYMKNIGE